MELLQEQVVLVHQSLQFVTMNELKKFMPGGL